MTQISVYVEVKKQAKQFEPVTIGINATENFDAKEGETPADTIRRGSRALYSVVSDQVDELMTDALNDLRG